MASTLKAQTHEDIVLKYNRVSDNIAYFNKVKSPIEEARNLALAANMMIELGDTVSAIDFNNRAMRNFNNSGLINNSYIIKLNLARTKPVYMQDSIFSGIRNDPKVRSIDRIMIPAYQNSFIFHEDSIQFIDSAIHMQKRSKEMGNIPLFLALKGEYYMRHGKQDSAFRYIREGFDSVHEGFYTSNPQLSEVDSNIKKPNI